MGFGSTIVDVMRRLVGISKETPVVEIDPSAAADVAPPEIEPEPEADDDSLAPTSARDEWEDMQAFVARCEAEAIDLCGIDIDDPTSFWRTYAQIEGTQPDPAAVDDSTRDARAKSAGFADLHHWEWVSQYYQIKWSELLDDRDPPEIRAKPSFTVAAEQLGIRRS